MKIATIGLGILFGQLFLKPLFFALALPYAGNRVDKTYELIMLSSEICVLLGSL